VLEDNNEVIVFIKATKNKKESEVYALRYDGSGEITSKSFDGNLRSDETSEPIETSLEGDETKKCFTNITYWYDKYFLA
jgi:hypothetical protein